MRPESWLLNNQSRIFALLVFSIGFAAVSTLFLGLHLLTPSAAGGESSIINGGTTFAGSAVSAIPQASLLSQIVAFFEDRSVIFAPSGWMLVGGLWIWRGRTKAAWTALGFDSEVFELLMRMKGGNTRARVMSSLSMPKDRLQLAQELGLDWKAVDHHIVLLCRYGFVHEQVAYGRVKMYELTSMGKMLMQLLKDVQVNGVQPENIRTAETATQLTGSSE